MLHDLRCCFIHPDTIHLVILCTVLTSVFAGNKIRSIEGFKGQKTPTVEVEGGYIPDLDSRYFTADFNYGLFVIMQVAELIGYRMPNCQEVFDWYQKIKNPGYGEFGYKDFGITDKDSFEKFYKM